MHHKVCIVKNAVLRIRRKSLTPDRKLLRMLKLRDGSKAGFNCTTLLHLASGAYGENYFEMLFAKP